MADEERISVFYFGKYDCLMVKLLDCPHLWTSNNLTIQQSNNHLFMTVCFIANFSKTYFFDAIAKELEKANFEVVWIVVNERLRDFLYENYSEESVLYLNRDWMQGEGEAIGEFKINELVFGDRVLEHEPANGIRFLTNIQQPIYDFLKKHKVKTVFGETTWAHEILVHRMTRHAKGLNCQYLNPHVVRIPNGRFAFFTDEQQSQILACDSGEKCDTIFELKKPDYLVINDKKMKKNRSLGGRLNRAKRFFTNENIDKNDPTLISNKVVQFRSRAGEEWRKETYRGVKRVDFEAIKNTNYVFIGLHKQPEASIDVFGRYYEDQWVNIKNIWRTLPHGWQLIVKEHTNAVGDRSLAFYQELDALPNLHFVHESTNSWALINAAKLVVTVTGTIAYEAALMQVPSLTLAPTFFNDMNYCRQITWNELNDCADLNMLCEDLKSEKDNRLEFCQYLMENSFDGTFSDPNANPKIMEKENIRKIADGFLQVLTKHTHTYVGREQEARTTLATAE